MFFQLLLPSIFWIQKHRGSSYKCYQQKFEGMSAKWKKNDLLFVLNVIWHIFP